MVGRRSVRILADVIESCNDSSTLYLRGPYVNSCCAISGNVGWGLGWWDSVPCILSLGILFL